MTRSSPLRVEAKLFRGLGDPVRLAILKQLMSGPKRVGQIVEHTGMSQPSVSQHLRCLKGCCLVESRKDGRQVLYRLKSRRVLTLLRQADSLLGEVYEGVRKCSRYR